MKRAIAVFLTMALLMAGCSSHSTDISSKENNSNKIFNVSSSYFDFFTSKQTENAYVVEGTVHNENDGNVILTYIQAKKNTGIHISGTMEKSSGADTKLIYVDPDGTETKITDTSSGTFEMTLPVITGDGTVMFKGKPSVCDFVIQFESLDEVDYYLTNS